MMTNRNKTVLYTGVTSNLPQRVEDHKNHSVKGFTNRYNLDKLVYYELIGGDADEAIHREKQLKRWRRDWKEELIHKQNPGWMDLSDEF